MVLDTLYSALSPPQAPFKIFFFGKSSPPLSTTRTTCLTVQSVSDYGTRRREISWRQGATLWPSHRCSAGRTDSKSHSCGIDNRG